MMSSRSKMPMMACGHTAQGFVGSERTQPVCVICYGITPKALIVADAPDLTGRKAVCAYCDKEVDSNIDLPFFEHRPHMSRDKYYDGCRGWD